MARCFPSKNTETLLLVRAGSTIHLTRFSSNPTHPPVSLGCAHAKLPAVRSGKALPCHPEADDRHGTVQRFHAHVAPNAGVHGARCVTPPPRHRRRAPERARRETCPAPQSVAAPCARPSVSGSGPDHGTSYPAPALSTGRVGVSRFRFGQDAADADPPTTCSHSPFMLPLSRSHFASLRCSAFRSSSFCLGPHATPIGRAEQVGSE